MKSIYSNRVWVNQKLQPASIEIKGEKINSIIKKEKINGAIDYGDLIIMPGVIDAHVHINEPGRTDWEGFETATKAAAKGGTTTLIDMPLNSNPVVTTVAAFGKKLDAAKGKLSVNCGFWAGAINGDGEAVIDLIKKGCLGVKVFLSHSGIDEFPNISLSDLDQQMLALNSLNVPVLAHCELDTLPTDTDLKNHPTSYREYLKSRPKAWENEAIKAFVKLGKKNKCKIHVVHLSSQDCIKWINAQKEKGVNLTVETCPHYLLFNAENIEDGNTLFKCAPPIRERANNEQLKAALKSGIIDFITTDHSPAPPNIKELDSGNLQKAWGGIAGLQFLLSASWTALNNDMALESFIPMLTSKPAAFLGLDQQIGYIEEGYQADFTIWQPDATFTATSEIIEHRHKATPYNGLNLFGKIHSTFVNGEVVFSEGNFLNLNAGRIILK